MGAHMCPCGTSIEEGARSRRMWNTQGGTGCDRGGDEEIWHI